MAKSHKLEINSGSLEYWGVTVFIFEKRDSIFTFNWQNIFTKKPDMISALTSQKMF